MWRPFVLSLSVICLAGCSPSVVKQSAPLGTSPTDSAPPSQSYTQTPEVLAHASIAAMSSLGWQVDYSQSKPPHFTEARTPLTLWTGGDRVQTRIGIQGDDGTTTVNVISCTDGQVYDWGKNEENIRRFFGALDSVITLGPEEIVGRTKFTEVIVTTGPLSQPYEALGEVQVSTVGMINLGSLLNDSLFRSKVSVQAAGATPTASAETVNRMLREEAQKKYGSQVDAVINVTYQTRPDGDVFANGLAVEFMEPEPVQTVLQERSLEDRLKELRDLREKNLITPEEYYKKREKLLEGL